MSHGQEKKWLQSENCPFIGYNNISMTILQTYCTDHQLIKLPPLKCFSVRKPHFTQLRFSFNNNNNNNNIIYIAPFIQKCISMCLNQTIKNNSLLTKNDQQSDKQWNSNRSSKRSPSWKHYDLHRLQTCVTKMWQGLSAQQLRVNQQCYATSSQFKVALMT